MRARAAGALAAAGLLGAVSASAQGVVVFNRFNRPGSGARAAGMANAFVAVSDDGTAASWNPAGLAQLRKPELSVVTNTSTQTVVSQGFRTRDDRSAFTTGRSSFRNTYLDFASLAVPVTLGGKPVTFQGSWRRLYTFDYREVLSLRREPLLDGAPPAAAIDTNNDLFGAIDLASVAGAVKLTSRLALGASFNSWHGDWIEHDWTSETPVEGPEGPRFLTFTVGNRIRGNNVNLGLMLTYPRFNVGALYQFPLESDLENRFTVTSTDDPEVLSDVIVGTLRWPQAVGLGTAWRPAAGWTVAFDLTWDVWTNALIDTPETGRVNVFDSLPPESTSTRDTVSFNAGAERLFAAEGFVIPLRFGVAREPQGPRNSFVRDPVSYTMLAVGTGYNTNSLKFDAAFQVRWATFRDGANFGADPAELLAPVPVAVGERSAREWRIKLSLILRVTDTDKLRGIFHKVFG